MRNKKLRTMRERNQVESGLIAIREASSSNTDTWLSECYEDSKSDIAKLFADNNLTLNLWLVGKETGKLGSSWVYRVEISNSRGTWKENYIDSIHNYNKDRLPNVYDLLTSWNCDQSFGIYIFDEFCSELYCDAPLADYPKVLANYQACQRAYVIALTMLGNDGLELLQKIQ